MHFVARLNESQMTADAQLTHFTSFHFTSLTHSHTCRSSVCKKYLHTVEKVQYVDRLINVRVCVASIMSGKRARPVGLAYFSGV